MAVAIPTTLSHRRMYLVAMCLILIVSSPSELHGQRASEDSPESLPPAIDIDYGALLPKGEYTDVLASQMRLILNDYWSADGNWNGDMMNDATAFAPRLLFHIYQKTGDERLYDRAITTCKYEMGLVREFVHGRLRPDINSIFGFYCLLDHMREAKTVRERLGSQLLAGTALNLVGRSLVPDPGQSSTSGPGQYESLTFPLVAWACLDYCEAARDHSLLEVATNIIEEYEDRFYDQGTGVFTGRGQRAWNEALRLLAHAKAYAVTKDEAYLEKAASLVENLRRRNPVVAAVFLDEVSLPRRSDWRLNFSTMLIYDVAFWELYKSTRETRYRTFLKRSIDFAVDEFTLSGAYPEGIEDQWFGNQKRVVPFFSHDIRMVDGVKEVAPSYCIGCNLLMLNLIWEYNNSK